MDVLISMFTCNYYKYILLSRLLQIFTEAPFSIWALSLSFLSFIFNFHLDTLILISHWYVDGHWRNCSLKILEIALFSVPIFRVWGHLQQIQFFFTPTLSWEKVYTLLNLNIKKKWWCKIIFSKNNYDLMKLKFCI